MYKIDRNKGIELKMKAYIIGKQLDRIDWYNMHAKDAENWCIERAKERGANDQEAEIIAYLAMNYVLSDR